MPTACRCYLEAAGRNDTRGEYSLALETETDDFVSDFITTGVIPILGVGGTVDGLLETAIGFESGWTRTSGIVLVRMENLQIISDRC